MKIAISAEGDTQNSPVDPRFGRARWFVLYDSDSGQYEAVDNSASAEAMQGAGPKAAELLAGREGRSGHHRPLRTEGFPSPQGGGHRGVRRRGRHRCRGGREIPGR